MLRGDGIKQLQTKPGIADDSGPSIGTAPYDVKDD